MKILNRVKPFLFRLLFFWIKNFMSETNLILIHASRVSLKILPITVIDSKTIRLALENSLSMMIK
jgi:hypothetical protein